MYCISKPHPKTDFDTYPTPTLHHVVQGTERGKEDGVDLLPKGVNVALACIALGRTRGHSYDGVTDPLARSALAGIT